MKQRTITGHLHCQFGEVLLQYILQLHKPDTHLLLLRAHARTHMLGIEAKKHLPVLHKLAVLENHELGMEVENILSKFSR